MASPQLKRAVVQAGANVLIGPGLTDEEMLGIVTLAKQTEDHVTLEQLGEMK